MGDTASRVKEAGVLIATLGAIGLIGIVFLIIYGNLSGNLGFGSDVSTFANDTINLTDVGNTPASAIGAVNPVLTNIVVRNSTNDLIASGNYTVTGALFQNATAEFGETLVNVSATLTEDSTGKVDTDSVINNLTLGYTTFFGFAPTFFTIAAIVLLIVMLIGLLGLVFGILGESRSKRSGFSGL